MADRNGAIEVDLYAPDERAATSRRVSWQSDLNRSASFHLAPLTGQFRTSDFISLTITPTCQMPGDWVLSLALFQINGHQMSIRPLLFRFADQEDAVPTGTISFDVPYFNAEGGIDKTETWWLTVRGCGSEERSW
jgi:hypothetical protein